VVATYNNSLLIVGGYRGQVLDDLLAVAVPPSVAKPNVVSDCQYSLSVYEGKLIIVCVTAVNALVKLDLMEYTSVWHPVVLTHVIAN
jgi:hypothetical protein